jgi:hypothetical protein
VALTITIKVEGARETLGAFRHLPREASEALRRETLVLAQDLAGNVAAAARADGPQTALMAPTVRALRDRVPAISAGGSSRVGSRHKPAYKIVFGSEFGATVHHQFRPHLGRGSYWLFRTVEEHQAQIALAWQRVAIDVQREFGRSVGGL